MLGCEHAPYEKIEQSFTKLGNLIIPFPILCKESESRIKEIIDSDPLLRQRSYCNTKVTVKSLLANFNSDPTMLLYGKEDGTGYPISEIMQATAFIIADASELNGKRTRGPYIGIIERHLNTMPNLSITMRKPDLLTPLILLGNGRGALISAVNPAVYEHLISIDPNNKYKLLVRAITESDLRNEQESK